MGLPLQECKRKTTSTEFVGWLHFYELDLDTVKKEDYYFAQISSEIRRSFVIKKARDSVTDMASSKSSWGALLGLNLGDK